MDRRPLRTTLFATALIALALGLSSVATAGPQLGSAGVRNANALEAPLLAKLNATRRSQGLPVLRRSGALARAAADHARAMGQRGFFSHSSADGTSAVTRIRRYYRGSAVGEAILWRSPDVSAAEAIQMWLNSPPHRAILLSRGYREVGFAAVQVENAGGAFGNRSVTIIVADFGAR
jgi:uncharacterized protein YkwD